MLERRDEKGLAERISRYLMALAHPERVALVFALDERGEMTSEALADETEAEVIAVLHHLEVLLAEAIVEQCEDGEAVVYRLPSGSHAVRILELILAEVEARERGEWDEE